MYDQQEQRGYTNDQSNYNICYTTLIKIITIGTPVSCQQNKRCELYQGTELTIFTTCYNKWIWFTCVFVWGEREREREREMLVRSAQIKHHNTYALKEARRTTPTPIQKPKPLFHYGSFAYNFPLINGIFYAAFVHHKRPLFSAFHKLSATHKYSVVDTVALSYCHHHRHFGYTATIARDRCTHTHTHTEWSAHLFRWSLISALVSDVLHLSIDLVVLRSRRTS